MANSKRKCPHCKAYNRPSEGVLIKGSLYCNMDCVVQKAKQGIPKGKAIKAKAEKKENNRKKTEADNNDRKLQFKLCKKAAQRLAVLLDISNGCISCRTMGDVQYCGGHYKTAGGHPELALDLRNIHKQCNRHCNCGLSGNIGGNKHSRGYMQGIIDRYGPEHLAYLEKTQPPKKYTCEQLIEIKKEYRLEIKRLESGLPPSKDWRALPD